MFQRFQIDSKATRRPCARLSHLLLRRLCVHRLRSVCQLALGLTCIGAIAPSPALAAEKINFHYGLYELTITRQELETFAATGTAEGGLSALLSRLDDDLAGQLYDLLQAQYDLNPVLASRFSYTRSGEQLLAEVGDLITTESGLNGGQALRGALVLAASEPDGLTLLNFIEQYPTNIRISISQVLSTVETLTGLLSGTQQTLEQLTAETLEQANNEASVDFSALPDPRLPGEFLPQMETLSLHDARRDRTLLVDVYTPIANAEINGIPVIVVSNGLGARRDRFADLAQYLASHGFAVALLDHPGSDRTRLQAFYQGFEPENFEPLEYLDRPLDVSFVLDELTRLNSSRFNRQLNPSQVGVFGYSFGGTTALALAGAQIDLPHLQQACSTQSSVYNISLLYQCRALELDPNQVANTPLQDPRIQAISVFVPFSRSLYGPEGLAQVQGPVLWKATDQDILTPFLIEQLPAFNWLAASDSNEISPNRYLTVAAGLPHARITFEVISRITQTKADWEQIRPIAENYHQQLNTAFFQAHLAGNTAYQPYLQAQGAQFLSQPPYSLTWQEIRQ
ncbi:MAG: alpha/beta fold hydrolase [Cyanobacteria bacterium J06649_5]